MSHEMLHHIELKYSLNCCTYLIWFEFDTWFEFELKTLEKINRKAIRNSLKIEKSISAHLAQASPAPHARLRPRALGAWQAGPACRRQLQRALSPSRCSVGPICRRRSFSPCTLSLYPADPTCQSSLTSRPRCPAVGAPTSAHSLATSPPLRPFWAPGPARPPPPAHLRPQLNPLALSLTLRARPEPRHRPPTSTARSTVVVELPATFVAPVSSALSPATWNTPKFAPDPSSLPCPHSPEIFPCSRSSATITPSRPCVRPQPLDLGRPSESGRFRFNQSGSDHNPPIQIQPPFSLSPHPRPCPWA
jgi:hypothetical protein